MNREPRESPRPAPDAAGPAPEDTALFQAAVQGIVPLEPEPRIPIARGASVPVPTPPLRRGSDALDERWSDRGAPGQRLDAGEEQSYLRTGHSPALLRRLRRGHWMPQCELDLHGRTREEAWRDLGQFLNGCILEHTRCVRIIHGKGHGSKSHEPVLKGSVRAWLMERDEVIAYCQTPPAMGGGGAVLVLLKR